MARKIKIYLPRSLAKGSIGKPESLGASLERKHDIVKSGITDSSCFLVTPAGGSIVFMSKQKHFAAAQGCRMFVNKPDKFCSITLILPSFHNVNCVKIVYFLPVRLIQNITVSKSDCFSVVYSNITVCVLFVKNAFSTASSYFVFSSSTKSSISARLCSANSSHFISSDLKLRFDDGALSQI